MLVILLYISYFILTLNLGKANGGVVQINDSNWKQILEGEWMVEFYAPWCPACQSLKKTWNEFGDWSKDLDIGVGEVDITLSPVLTGRCLITALPTIFHIKDGVFRQFRGSRKTKDFLDFIEDKQWEAIDPMSNWQDPGSVQMGILGYFFKLSYVMKDYHKILTEDYKFSTWVSYAFFTAATILVGGLLGLAAVLVLDQVRSQSLDLKFLLLKLPFVAVILWLFSYPLYLGSRETKQENTSFIPNTGTWEPWFAVGAFIILSLAFA